MQFVWRTFRSASANIETFDYKVYSTDWTNRRLFNTEILLKMLSIF